jgi:hypothetical protein
MFPSIGDGYLVHHKQLDLLQDRAAFIPSKWLPYDKNEQRRKYQLRVKLSHFSPYIGYVRISFEQFRRLNRCYAIDDSVTTLSSMWNTYIMVACRASPHAPFPNVTVSPVSSQPTTFIRTQRGELM